MKALFIYNKNSGKGKILKYISYIEKELKEVYEVFDIISPESEEEFKSILKSVENKYDVIVFSGGDGTFNMLINAIGNFDKIPILGYIPTGTCNDIARNNKIPLKIKKAIKVIKDGNIKPIDVIKTNINYFLYAMAIGTGSSCTYITTQESKRKLGRLGYLKNIIKQLLTKNIVHAKLITDDEIIEGDYALIYVLNTREVGSFVFNPKAKLNSGKVEVVMIKKGKRSGRFNIVRFMLGRLLGIKRLPIDSRILDKFKIEVDGTWNMDGEKGPDNRLEFEVLHNKAEVYYKK